MPAPRLSSRLPVALALASLAGWSAGLLQHGVLLGHPAAPRAVLSVVALGGALAGLLRGAFAHARALYVFPFVLYCATLTFSTSTYLRERGRIWNAELLLPSALSLAPFSVAYRAVGRHLDTEARRRRRDSLDD